MEQWKDIIGYEGLYQISDMGNVRSKITGKLRSLNNCNRYTLVTLAKNGKQKALRVHRLVAIHFIPNPENKPEVNHKWGNKRDNRATELEWSTRSENMLHSYAMGIHWPTTVENRKLYQLKKAS